MAKEFLGIGWKFPVAVDGSTGKIAMSEYEEDIKESIRIILFTSRGERVMQPDFGCSIHDFFFDSMSTTTLGLVESSVHEALTRWETRINLVAVKVSADDIQAGKLLIDITYLVRTTNNEFNLVYPFYLRE
ncbi:baseplate protein [Bacillus pseudomycoides]|uniref:GPW/gp25 family protein n=1 Tax=Bacillus pseudomycoides TaxID=64104 RepID=UPI000BED46B9|nr:GPW/gp25 family protein [Bacillus pseudomycoides]MBD5799846.1 baseplate protein [Bacillus pseudomycoides]MED1476532.1 GPW/gp25 family protein [Bacillus pseudomycoides]PDZ13451.1 baseplate protein [Bacillus pseudomycoides]PEO78117.1 baseplate protein [Bacillus pseudomycoides]